MRALAFVALTVCVVGCGLCGKSGAIATLEKAEGPVERQAAGESAWTGASIGTKYFLGDAVRTGDGGAQLALSGGAQIAMQKHTVLRFGGKNGQTRLSVELGAIDLSGTGNVNLDVGDVKLTGGKVRITARGDGKSEIKLTLGTAEVQTLAGETINLKLDLGVELGAAEIKALIDAGVDAPIDAGVIDAPIDAPPVSSGATVSVTGKKGEIQLLGESKFAPLPEGDSDLPVGAIVKTGAGTTAKLVAAGTTLEMSGGSRATYTDKSVLTMDIGTAKITTTTEGSVALPGGAIAIKNAPNNPAEVGIAPGQGGTKVTINRGVGSKLTGNGGSNLDMARGESATLLKSGVIRPLEANPSYFDFRITAGEGNFTIHDPRPPTAVQFQFGGKCTDGIIELDRDARFRTAKVSAGKDAANHYIKPGAWSYQLRCTSGGTEGKAVASGRIVVTPDAGSRPIPKLPGTSPFEPNGMSWKFGYQSVIPDLDVRFPGTGKFTLHLARGGNDKAFPSESNRLRVPGKELSEGSYSYWFDRDGVRQDKANQVKIEFDNTLPQVYIELPVYGRPWVGDIDVKGAVIAGWSAAVNDVGIPLDGARRFIAKVQPPPGNALAIKLSHPQRGVHYYLRRQK